MHEARSSATRHILTAMLPNNGSMETDEGGVKSDKSQTNSANFGRRSGDAVLQDVPGPGCSGQLRMGTGFYGNRVFIG